MRVAFVTPEYVTTTRSDGGLANYLKKTAAAISGREWDVWMFIQSGQDAIWQDGSVTVCEVKCPSVLFDFFVRFPYVRRFSPALYQLVAARKVAHRFWEVHAKKPFDIIQAPSYKAPGYALLKNGRVPLVCRASSYAPLCRAAYGRKRGIGEYLCDLLETCQMSKADARFAPSRFIADTYAKLEACELQVIPTPVESYQVLQDLSYFETHRPPDPYLLYFGTLSMIKGVDMLADTLPAIFKKYPNMAVVFIGRDDGMPNGMKIFDYVVSKCREYKSRLSYYQAQPKDRLYPFIAHAEAILLPSRVDNYPNVCLEAQMFGKPVIGTRESSLEEMIQDGKTGFLANNSDVDSLTRAIEQCLNMTGEEKEEMSTNILSHIDDLKREDRVSQLLQFYKETISEFKGTNIAK